MKHTKLAVLLRRTSVRHVTVLVIVATLVGVFAFVHAQWSPLHRWNRAFGDASLALVALAMGLGPFARLVRPATVLLPLRREFGIHAAVAALVHGTIILIGWVQLDLMRLFGFEFHPVFEDYVMVEPGFGLANAIGIAALVFVSVLALTSNDLAVRRLGSSAWKFLQMGVLPLWWLTIAHVGYFLFAHFLNFQRPTTEPNPLQGWFVALVLLVLALRGVAYLQSLRRQGLGGRTSPTDTPPI